MEWQLERCERASSTDCQIIAEWAILRKYRACGASQTSSKDARCLQLEEPPWVIVFSARVLTLKGNGSRGSSVCGEVSKICKLLTKVGEMKLGVECEGNLKYWSFSVNKLSDHWKTQNKKFAEPSFITHSNWEGDLRRVTKSDDFILKWSSVSGKRGKHPSPASPPPTNEKFYSEVGCGDRVKITHLISRPPPPESVQAGFGKCRKLISFPQKILQGQKSGRNGIRKIDLYFIVRALGE
ncbi:hypothetical protein SCHPADRAFT_897257 [Schizopora paradoxa]|uniref:Uncharacterized protein n=1 Tax=Schizopora paradoxa TaxID=27342 RepID=A0A0H2RGV4_9AGAM|nr:hypothetical protein SCHPADRAFT_897257 [Schizopora paradoxa]